MAKDIKYHFYLKDKAALVPTPINFVINKGSFRGKKAIGENILPQWWDFEKERAIESNQQNRNEAILSKRVNRKITRIELDIEELFDDYVEVEKITPNHYEGKDILEELFQKVSAIIDNKVGQENKEEERSRITPTQFFEDFIAKWARATNARTNRTPTKGTMFNYENTIRRYKDFIHDNQLKDSFRVFDSDFQFKFDAYLIEEQDITPNTVASTHSQLKVMLKRAEEEHLLSDTSYKHWSTKCAKIQHAYLDDSELNALLNLVITDEIRKKYNIGQESHIEETRDLFIISSRTGLRFSDLKSLNKAEWEINEGDDSFVTILIQKTRDRLTIPLHRNVIQLYKKYDGHFPLPIDKGHFNDQIRLCAKLAGIDKLTPYFRWGKKGQLVPCPKAKWELISSHTGRRSFCTNLFLTCHSAKMVMNLSGHTSEDNFNRYIGVSQAELAKESAQYINLDEATSAEFDKFIKVIQENAIEKQKLEDELAEMRRKYDTEDNRPKSEADMIRERLIKDKIQEIGGFWRNILLTQEQMAEINAKVGSKLQQLQSRNSEIEKEMDKINHHIS